MHHRYIFIDIYDLARRKKVKLVRCHVVNFFILIPDPILCILKCFINIL